MVCTPASRVPNRPVNTSTARNNWNMSAGTRIRSSRNGNATTTVFDARDRIIRIIDAVGGEREFTYDAVDNVLTDKDENGNVTRYEYDLGDRLMYQTDALGVVTRFVYDEADNRVSITQALGISDVKGRSPWEDAWHRLLKNRAAVVSGIIMALMVLAVVFGPMLLPWEPDFTDWDNTSSPPSLETGHWFGTDAVGRDLLVRTLEGGRISLLVGLVATLVSLAIGVTYGAVAGYYGLTSFMDEQAGRVLDALEHVAENHVDIVLLDVRMPGMDGLDFVRTFRSEESAGRHLPIIALTANVMQPDIDELERYRFRMDDSLRHNDPMSAYEIFSLYSDRVLDRVADLVGGDPEAQAVARVLEVRVVGLEQRDEVGVVLARLELIQQPQGQEERIVEAGPIASQGRVILTVAVDHTPTDGS